MPSVRHGGREYELVNVHDDGSFIVRDEGNNVRALEASVAEPVLVQCSVCGRFSDAVAPLRDGRWVCHDRECGDG